MRRVKLTASMKCEDPFVVVGDAGDTILLSTPAAEWVARQGNGRLVSDELGELGPTRAQLEAEEARHGTLKKIGEEKVVTEPDEDKVVEPEEIKRPYGNAPKSAWVRYAVSVDSELSEERAEDMTKADLMSKYGSRLGEED